MGRMYYDCIDRLAFGIMWTVYYLDIPWYIYIYIHTQLWELLSSVIIRIHLNFYIQTHAGTPFHDVSAVVKSLDIH